MSEESNNELYPIEVVERFATSLVEYMIKKHGGSLKNISLEDIRNDYNEQCKIKTYVLNDFLSSKVIERTHSMIEGEKLFKYGTAIEVTKEEFDQAIKSARLEVVEYVSKKFNEHLKKKLGGAIPEPFPLKKEQLIDEYKLFLNDHPAPGDTKFMHKVVKRVYSILRLESESGIEYISNYRFLPIIDRHRKLAKIGNASISILYGVCLFVFSSFSLFVVSQSLIPLIVTFETFLFAISVVSSKLLYSKRMKKYHPIERLPGNPDAIQEWDTIKNDSTTEDVEAVFFTACSTLIERGYTKDDLLGIITRNY